MRILLSLICFSFSSCISSTIAGKGKDITHLYKSDTTMEEVEQELGSPISSVSYPHPLRVQDTSEYKSLSEYYMEIYRESGFSPELLTTAQLSNKASHCMVYSFKGTLSHPQMNMHYDMTSAMTLGLSEILMIPSAIVERYERSNSNSRITVWYDSNYQNVAIHPRNQSREQDAAPNHCPQRER